MATMGDIARYQKVLKESPFFSDFEETELTRLIECCEPRELAPREALWAVGERGGAAYILIEGQVEQSRRLMPEGQRVRQFDQVGALLGLSYLARDWEHQSAAKAQMPTELLQLERERFQALLNGRDPVAFHLIDKLAEELVQDMRDANRRLQDVFGNPAETLRTLRRRVRTS